MAVSEIDLRVSIQADPRISNMRPGWLTDDQQWRDQLQAMDDHDWRWIEKHWDMAGGKGPAVDMSWVTTEEIGGTSGWWLLVGAVALLFAVVAVPLLALVAR